MKRYLVALTMIISIVSADSLFEKANRVMIGEESPIIKEITVNNCPYDRCTNKKKGFSKIKVTLSNQSKAIALYLESMRTEGEYRSAMAILSFLSKQIDYTASKPNKFLLKQLKKNIGLDQASYANIVKEAISFLLKQERCVGFYWLAKYSKSGFVYENTAGIPELLEKGKSVCESSEDSLYSLIYKKLIK